jgi:hypothetical protein
MLKIRSLLGALALFAGLAVAHAQTTQQNHDAHHPEAPATSTMPGPGTMTGEGMGMDQMMSGNMHQMMRAMMGRIMSEEGMPGMGPMGPMGPRAGMFGLRHIEGQIAFYKAELRITDAQTTQWNAFADALRAGAKRLQAAHTEMMPGDGPLAVPDQLAKRRQWLTAELDSLQAIEPATRALYDVLSPEQKKDADALMADHLWRM